MKQRGFYYDKMRGRKSPLTKQKQELLESIGFAWIAPHVCKTKFKLHLREHIVTDLESDKKKNKQQPTTPSDIPLIDRSETNDPVGQNNLHHHMADPQQQHLHHHNHHQHIQHQHQQQQQIQQYVAPGTMAPHHQHQPPSQQQQQQLLQQSQIQDMGQHFFQNMTVGMTSSVPNVHFSPPPQVYLDHPAVLAGIAMHHTMDHLQQQHYHQQQQQLQLQPTTKTEQELMQHHQHQQSSQQMQQQQSSQQMQQQQQFGVTNPMTAAAPFPYDIMLDQQQQQQQPLQQQQQPHLHLQTQQQQQQQEQQQLEESNPPTFFEM
jgi:hypothetical protein